MTDSQFIQIVDSAMAEAAQRSGDWLKCRPGCAQCCLGPFEITQLDALRLREGLSRLDPGKAARILERARSYEGLDDEPCPALDPATSRCELYPYRPVTCRTFGPPALAEDGSYSVCELCFEGATEEQIAACHVDPDPNGVEMELMRNNPGVFGSVAEALANDL